MLLVQESGFETQCSPQDFSAYSKIIHNPAFSFNHKHCLNTDLKIIQAKILIPFQIRALQCSLTQVWSTCELSASCKENCSPSIHLLPTFKVQVHTRPARARQHMRKAKVKGNKIRKFLIGCSLLMSQAGVMHPRSGGCGKLTVSRVPLRVLRSTPP